MIVKIWGVEGETGLTSSLEYINDKEKMGLDDEDKNIFEQAMNNAENNSDLKRAFQYVGNEDKIKGTYLSGYLCDPETAFEEFAIARNQTIMKSGKDDSDGKYIAFHLVQSMPEGIDISDEEVHQCGIELAKKIGAHQAVIASHVHPVIDEETGEIHGKCKHNHILINAYIHPDKLDPRFPNRIKYYDNKTSYAKLQIWNDQIAMEHGLPIISNPDIEKTYSWAELDAIKYNLSWKEHIRMDIDEVMYQSSSWDEFKNKMIEKGYEIKSGKHITYTTPEDANGERKKIRDYKLGRAYTKDALLSYWKELESIKNDVEKEIDSNDTEEKEIKSSFDSLSELNKKYDKLYVGIPLGIGKNNINDLYYLPFDTDLERDILKTYFTQNELYSVFTDSSPSPVSEFQGQDIYNFILQEQEKEREKEEQIRKQNERLQKNWEREKRESGKYYSYHLFVNSRTKKPYRIGLYDQNGRRRSNLELMFILAAVVIRQEDKLWSVNSTISQEQSNNVYFGKTDYKAQNMMNSIRMAREENIGSLSELDERINAAGAELSRSKSALKKNENVKEKMETVYSAVSIYLENKEIAEAIFKMPEGVNKEEQTYLHQEEIENYNKAKRIMYRYNVKTDNDINDLLERYEHTKNQIDMYTEKIQENKREYSKLKKIEHNAALAEDPKYCYGPLYDSKSGGREVSPEKEVSKDEMSFDIPNMNPSKSKGTGKKADGDKKDLGR